MTAQSEASLSGLVSTDWLAANLSNPAVRILDCTVEMHSQPVGLSQVISGRAQWAERHIPGAAYASMVEGFAQPGRARPYAFPDADVVSATLQKLGVNRDTQIILYASGRHVTVTRVWWVLYSYGLRNIRILDGGLEKWLREGRPVESEVPQWPSGNAVAKLNPAFLANQADVLSAIGRKDICLLNALNPEQFFGSGGSHYGRPGRIPWSVNVPSRDLVDAGSGTFLGEAEIRSQFSKSGALQAPKVIAYCGGGVAATAAAFALIHLGHPDVAVYDGSLAEWSSHAELPMVSGDIGPWG